MLRYAPFSLVCTNRSNASIAPMMSTLYVDALEAPGFRTHSRGCHIRAEHNSYHLNVRTAYVCSIAFKAGAMCSIRNFRSAACKGRVAFVEQSGGPGVLARLHTSDDSVKVTNESINGCKARLREFLDAPAQLASLGLQIISEERLAKIDLL
ncbi:hypothetical protein HDU89_006820 [Geranomyces variabilis]|nr:hypothetical protein HDU89_006820 [Geranomyces variabilis]